MRRREFLGAIGGLATLPLAARAQPANRAHRIAVLPAGYAQTDPEGQARVAAFLDTFQKLGWSNGGNVNVEIRWPAKENERVRTEASGLVGLTPDAIVVSSNLALGILQNLNATIPTVFVQVSDPVGSGIRR